MSKIIKQDTNGVKSLLQVGELGYDNYPAGGDVGRVFVGTGTENIAQAKKAEVVAVDGKVDTHIGRVDNPHGVTKTQVGLSNVDNTADSVKAVASAGKWTTPRNIALTGDVTGNIDMDGSAGVSIATTISPNSVVLGTDTTGNYVAGNTAGTGITVTGTAGEGWSPTIAIDSTVATLTGAQTLTNKTLQDSTTFIVDNTDATKKVQFDVAGVTTATTRTMMIPNVNGTIVTTGDTGTVTSTMIADGTIVNADINASAGIVDTKLATISTAGKVANSATTASSSNVVSSIVARDANGDFSAGAITASLIGNADSASRINIVSTDNAIVRFNGTIGDVQDSLASINDSGEITAPRFISSLAGVDALLLSSGVETRIVSRGTSDLSKKPMAFFIGTAEACRIDTSGNFLITSGTGGLGYGAGAGGTVTQLTSKATTVTLNKPSGRITMHNTALAAGAVVYFTVNNSLVEEEDTVSLSPSYTINPANYRVEVAYTSNGLFSIRVTNITGGSLSEALVFKFNIIKGAVA